MEATKTPVLKVHGLEHSEITEKATKLAEGLQINTWLEGASVADKYFGNDDFLVSECLDTFEIHFNWDDATCWDADTFCAEVECNEAVDMQLSYKDIEGLDDSVYGYEFTWEMKV